MGNRYEHLALEVDGDLPGVIEKLRAQGVKIVKEPKKSPGGNRAIAFVEDPNGSRSSCWNPAKARLRNRPKPTGRP